MGYRFGLTSTNRRGRTRASRILGLAATFLFAAGAFSVGDVAPASATGLTTACQIFSNNNPSNFGDNVNISFFVRVTTFPGPFGGVALFDGANPVPFATLVVTPDKFGTSDHSSASVDTSSLSPGTHVINALFVPVGALPCPPGTPVALIQVVNSAQSTTALTSSVNPTVFGQSTTFTATVTKPGGGTPTGTVQFSVDGSPSDSPQNVNASGVASISTAALAVGPHPVTASFASDNPATLNSDATLAGGQQVNAAATTTGITSSKNPAEFGAPVTFTANVSVNAPGAGTPTGAVHFQDNGADLGTPVLDGTGQATVTTSSLAVGNHTITAVYQPADGNFLTSSTSLTQAIERARTTLTYNGATTGDYHDPVSASATLARLDDGTPVPGQPVNLTVGSQTCTTNTDTFGVAQCTIRVEDPAGTTTATASFAGDGNYQPSNTTTPFTITREQTAIVYNGDTVILNGNTLHASAVLSEADSTPYPILTGRVVVFTLGTGSTAQTCSALTDTNGRAACNISPVAQTLGPTTITANFAQDAYYLASSTTHDVIIYAFPTKGAFAISTSRSAIGSQVTYFGAQWSSANPLSSGSAPNSFKGFITAPGTPPACGGSFTAAPGNSGAPPANVPTYMGTIATSTVAKNGSTITGDRTQIVVVRTDGYGSLGNGGTGTVVAIVCS